MESKNLEGVELVVGHHLHELAKKADVSREYVRMIVTGKRRLNTIRAKAIFAAAVKLNNGIKRGTTASEKELIIIGEND